MQRPGFLDADVGLDRLILEACAGQAMLTLGRRLASAFQGVRQCLGRGCDMNDQRLEKPLRTSRHVA